MRPPLRPRRVGVSLCFAALVVGAGCHDVLQLPEGAACSEDAQCASGMCYWAICLEPDGDYDGDGLTNAQERTLRSDPTRADTDGDGIPDLVEVGPDINNPRDTDGDGKPDIIESAIHDADLDCINDQFDPEDTIPETDLAVVARTVCRTQGVCSPPGLVTVSCLRIEVDGVLGSQAICDYSAVPDYDGNVEVRCDGLDNDCDGRTDEDLGYLDPFGELRGVGQSCVGTGACASLTGTVECSADLAAICSVNQGGSEFGGALVDIDCDRIDNNCDGRTDEGVSWIEPATGEVRLYGEGCVARGVCGLVVGAVECAPGTTRGICSTEPGASEDQSAPEVCDGADNDCDGLTDDDLFWEDGYGRSIAVGEICGLGACAGGVVVCAANGRPTCSTLSLGTGGLERCNGIDDDCDGTTDEPEGLALGCPTVGVCADLILRRGSCRSDGELLCEYDPPGVYQAGAEVWCDGLDDNCDGETDEGFVTAGGLALGAPCVGQGACAGLEGVVVCSADRRAAVCSADLNGTPEVCNGIDDDCDGTTDQASADLPGGGVCAVLGVCSEWAALGPYCAGGEWVCGYFDSPLWEPVETRCDGLDNDCDGLTDAGLPRLPRGEYAHVDGAQPEARARWPIAGSAERPLVFGGLSASSQLIALDDLWRYDSSGHAWTRVRPIGGPGPRAGHAVAWEPTREVLLVHGGFAAPVAQAQAAWTADGEPLSDLWVFDPATGEWASVEQQLNGVAATAIARRHHALVALSGDRLLMHGGLLATQPVGVSVVVPAGALTPTALSGALEVDVAAGGKPSWRVVWTPLLGAPARAGHTLVAGAHGRVFIVGGVGPSSAASDATAPQAYVWAGDMGAPWQALPAVATDHAPWWSPGAAATGDGGLVVVADGGSWRFSAGEASWGALGGIAELAAGHVALAADGEVRLFEVGRSDGGGRATWRLEGDAWEPVAVWDGPEPRLGATLVAHPRGYGVWVVGGARAAAPGGVISSAQALGDAWRLDPESGRWSVEVAPVASWEDGSATAPVFAEALGIWDSVADRILLLGGHGAAASGLWSYTPSDAAFEPVAVTGDRPGGDRVLVFAASDTKAWALSVSTAGGPVLRRLDLATLAWTRRWDPSLGYGPTSFDEALVGGLAGGRLHLATVGAGSLTLWSIDLAHGAWSGPTPIQVAGLTPQSVAGLGWDPAAGAAHAFIADPAGPRLAWVQVAPVAVDSIVAPWARHRMAVALDPVIGLVGFGGARPAGVPHAGAVAFELTCP